MLRRLDELASGRHDFAFETTLSGTAFLKSFERWRSAGYIIRLVYLWLSSAGVAISRVRARVHQGGHSVPEEVTRQRYWRSLANFADRYRTAADEWQLYDKTPIRSTAEPWRGVHVRSSRSSTPHGGTSSSALRLERRESERLS